jgi:phosphoglycolate phosphatase (TIGR01487 family)
VKKKTFAVDIDGTITENGGGRIHLDALSALRYITKLGHNVIFVSGRSSIEGYMLSMFGGTTPIAVGENGGCITYGPQDHILLGNMQDCKDAYNIIKSKIQNVKEKPVFPRLTEMVLERTFDLKVGMDIIKQNELNVILSDSLYAFHINSHNINKKSGFENLMNRHSISKNDVIAIGDSETDIPLFELAKTSIALGNASEIVKSNASMTVQGKAGDGVIEALDIIFPQLNEEVNN